MRKNFRNWENIMQAIDRDIKQGNFKNVYLLYGNERYLLRQYRNKLKNAMIPLGDTMNISVFEEDNLNVKTLIDVAETMPFFAERRLILIENSKLLKKGNEELANYIAELPKTTYLVFVEEEVDKRKLI